MTRRFAISFVWLWRHFHDELFVYGRRRSWIGTWPWFFCTGSGCDIKRHALTLSFPSRLFHFRHVRKEVWEKVLLASSCVPIRPPAVCLSEWMKATHAERIFVKVHVCDFHWNLPPHFRFGQKMTDTRQEGQGTVMDTDRSVRWTIKRLTKGPELCKKSTGSTTSRHLRERYRKHDISPFTREVQEARYLAIYERGTGSTTSRHLRERYRKHDISPFTREVQEARYLAIYERGTGSTISCHLRERYRKHDISQFTREVQEMYYVDVDEVTKVIPVNAVKYRGSRSRAPPFPVRGARWR